MTDPIRIETVRGLREGRQYYLCGLCRLCVSAKDDEAFSLFISTFLGFSSASPRLCGEHP